MIHCTVYQIEAKAGLVVFPGQSFVYNYIQRDGIPVDAEADQPLYYGTQSGSRELI